MAFTSIEDIQKHHPIIFDYDIVESFSSELLNIYNGLLEFDKYEEDTTGILYLNVGHYFYFVCVHKEKALKYYYKSYEKNCLGSFISIALLIDDNDKRIDLYERYLSIRPNEHIAFYSNLYNCYVHRNDPNDHERMTEIRLRLVANNDPLVILYFGEYYCKNGDLILAREYYEKAKHIFEHDFVYQKNIDYYLSKCQKLLDKIRVIE